jgi:hypothetical protein
VSKPKAMSSQKARNVRAQGYSDAISFAKEIGLNSDYKNDMKAKKDVIDRSGDAHSVKGGVKRWQIFLYGKNRFETDDAFQSMNGIGQLLIKALEIFPINYIDYIKNKRLYKENLKIVMRELKDKLTETRRVKTFLSKAFFNGGEVNYLTVRHDGAFHVFSNKDVVNILGEYLDVSNSQALKENDMSEQKVLFKYRGVNVGELEVRNSGQNHYREILFVVNKLKILNLLFDKIQFVKKFNNNVFVYGKAGRKFGRW